MTPPSATVAELAIVVACPRCKAPPGICCAEKMKLQAQRDGDPAAAAELDVLARAPVHLSHPERLQATEEAIESAIAYGLVRRVPARRRRPARRRSSP